MTLITSANSVDMAANGTADVIVGTSGADAYIVADGAVGDDTIQTFGKNDTLLTTKKIFDSNNDGIISFGSNGVLDVDRTSGFNPGEDQLTLGGLNPEKGLRYLGTKDGYFVYATATVKPKGSIEGTVNDDALVGTANADKFFYDTALGLDLGSDTITNFGHDDRLITTVALYDSNSDGFINFGVNGVLDLPGSTGPSAGDPSNHLGGQLDVFDTDGNDVVGLFFDGSTTVNGVTYYYYSLDGIGLP